MGDNGGMKKLATHNTSWDLSPLLSPDKPAEALELRRQVTGAIDGFAGRWKTDESYMTSLDSLLEALTQYEQLWAKYGTTGPEGYYYWLSTSRDQNNTDLKAKEQSINDFGNENLNKIQFFELQLGKVTAAQQKAILADARFKPYYHFLERNFETAKFSLSEAEEKIMNLKTDTSYSKWVDMTESFLAKELREVKVSDGSTKMAGIEELLSLCADVDPGVRTRAAAAFNDILDKNAPIAEAEMNAVLANKKTNDEIRGYARPDTSRHVGDDIETEAVDALLEVVGDHNQVARDFYTLKAQLLGQKQLAYHERNMEYGAVDQAYTFDEACELVHKVCERLDPGFSAIFERFLEKGQIDVFPAPGKRGGAYCAYNTLAEPTYMFLNYTSKLRDVTTLAHELGHGINDEYMREAQNSLTFGTPMATAEVASQFLEDFVFDELSSNADDEMRLALNMSRLNDAVSSVFRQIACYRFEQDLHNEFRRQGYLSKEEIGRLFTKNMSAYMGDAVEQSPGSQNWWVYWSHIRTYFYVYSYGGGLLIAKAMQAGVRKDKAYMEKVKTFLSGGRSASPGKLFAGLGIDIYKKDFWESGIADFSKLLGETRALATKLGKI